MRAKQIGGSGAFSSRFRVFLIVDTTVPLDLSEYRYRLHPLQFLFKPEIRHGLAFVHRQHMMEQADNYDLFIYSENDVLIREENLEAYLRVTERLPPEYLSGFLRYETRDEEEEYAAYEREEPERPLPGECILFAATIGPGIDRETARLSEEGETYNALLLNGIGAAAADLVAVDLELYMNAREPPPEGRWRRFHVGYGDFHLEAQRILFDFLDPGRIGVTLTPACLMVPEKSVSGIMAAKKG